MDDETGNISFIYLCSFVDALSIYAWNMFEIEGRSLKLHFFHFDVLKMRLNME